jgi:hypothetical protein
MPIGLLDSRLGYSKSELLSKSPIRRGSLKAEVAGIVYAEPAHVGRGGWTWDIGSAGWMYRAGLEAAIDTTRHEGTEPSVAPAAGTGAR